MKKDKAQKPDRVSYRRLVFAALPEIVVFQIIASIILGGLSLGLKRLINIVAESGDGAATTANLKSFLLSWQGPLIILLGFILVVIFVVFEIFAGIHLCDDILNGRRVGAFGEIGKAFRSVRLFLCPGGFLVLLYIFLAVPLVGFGFSISLSKSFVIPSFIMEVVRATPLYYTGYWVGMIALIFLGIRGVFTLHAVLIDGMKPGEGRKASVQLFKNNWKNFLGSMLKAILLLAVVNFAIQFILVLPSGLMEEVGTAYPHGYYVDPETIFNNTASELDYEVTGYRFFCALTILCRGFFTNIVVMLSGAYMLLRVTRCYYDYTHEAQKDWPVRPKRHRFWVDLLLILFFIIFIFLFSAAISIVFNSLGREENVRIVAHRTGGIMATENSIEGLELAIDQGCYACETDTQRTKDGRYIINHDSTFKRLTGVDKTPGEMTLAEIRRLTITDPGTGATSKVPTVEEMLDAVKGRGRLFLELKGVSADSRMVDDLVKIIRKRGCEEYVTFISLDYSVINYAEKNYPEFETGVLMFGGLGDVSRLNCDLLILEEEMATNARISEIHDSGKQVYVWTVNTQDGLYKFLDSDCDGIITDQVVLAGLIQEQLDNRTDYELLHDKFDDFWD